MFQHSPRSRLRACARLIPTVMLVALTAPRARAQTDYHNTDRGRPLRIEDASPVERFALELQLQPLRVERAAGGAYTWGLEPSLAWGLLPRTHVEIGAPLAWRESNGRGRAAIAGLEVEILHALNVETTTLPAIALTAGALLPSGGFGPSRALTEFGALVTRSLAGAVRLHVNGTWSPDGADAPPGVHEISRWLAGAAVDKTFPLRSLLVGIEAYARRPLEDSARVEWTSSAGIRYQLDPRVALDLGAGYRTSDTDRAWFFSVGGAYALGWLGPFARGGR